SHIRDVNTDTKEFRELVDEVSMLKAFEITRDLPLKKVTVETPVIETESSRIAGKKVELLQILRDGKDKVEGRLQLVPAVKVEQNGLYRDPKTLLLVEYYVKLPPDIEERILIVLDPMLATGGSANDAIESLKKRGAKNIKLVCLIAASEGVELI